MSFSTSRIALTKDITLSHPSHDWPRKKESDDEAEEPSRYTHTQRKGHSHWGDSHGYSSFSPPSLLSSLLPLAAMTGWVLSSLDIDRSELPVGVLHPSSVTLGRESTIRCLAHVNIEVDGRHTWTSLPFPCLTVIGRGTLPSSHGQKNGSKHAGARPTPAPP